MRKFKFFPKVLYCTVPLIVCLNMLLEAQEKKVHKQSPLQEFSASTEEVQKIRMQDKLPFYLIKLKPGVKRSDLITNKIEIIRYLRDGFAIIKSNAIPPMSVHAMFDTILIANHSWKLSDALQNTHPEQKNTFIIRTANGKSSSVKNEITSLSSIDVLEVKPDVLTVQTSLRFILLEIIQLNDVVYVGREMDEAVVESRVLDLNLEANGINRVHHEFPELNGEGLTLSIKELSYNPEDIDLIGRHVPSALSSGQIDNHATDMATIAVGAGNSFVTGRGVAKGTSITSSDYINLFPDEDTDYETLHAWVQNHSYGTNIENFYGALAESFDLNTSRNPELLHIFSSGNKGTETSLTGNYQGIPGFANITGNFKMSKNTLVVGSVDTVGRNVILSSRGPAFDGRVKPDIVAYSMAGSSNSAALVSGVSILLQQSYNNLYDDLPAAGLLKVLLINSADDAGAPGIDFVTGFGNVNAYKSIHTLNSNQFARGEVAHGETDNMVISVPSGARNLKVTLVWNDPAASVNSAIALVNDLDIKLIDQNDEDWLPWVLDSTPDITKLTLPATRKADHLNNVEQVSVETPISGDFVISVSGFDVPDGPQEYFVAYQWDMGNQFEWTFPTGSDNMPYNGETTSYFRWHSTLQEETGKLEYSMDNGDTWIVLSESIDLSKGYFRWMPPFITGVAIARMSVGSEVFVTDDFVISRPLTIGVGFNCADSVMLQWNSVPEAVAYKLFAFNNTHSEEVLTTSDTTTIFNKADHSSLLYSVQPVLPADKKAIRSYMYDYEQQGVDCFVQNFYSILQGVSGVRLTLQVGTFYGIDQIQFEHRVNGSFELLESVNSPEDVLIEYLDGHPNQGVNVYRARILLQNGEEVITELSEIFYLTEKRYAIFPNPTDRSTGLYVNSSILQNPSGILRLYRTDGMLTLTCQFTSDREVVDLSDIIPGFYFYSIESGGHITSGKIVITK